MHRRAVSEVVGASEPDYFGFVGIAESQPEYGQDTSERAEEVLREALRREDPHQ